MKTKFVKTISFLFLILLFGFTANGQSGDDSNKIPKTAENQKTDRPLKIIRKTPPSINSFQECFKISRVAQLSVTLRVTFHSSGKITAAEIATSSGCEYFDKEGLRVAQKIKFEPAIKHGEVVTVTRTVEYKAGLR